MMMNESIAKRGRGRPAAYDPETALNAAMKTFWAHGFEGTSMSTLCDALAMNKASIYAAFGSKEALFRKVLECYVSGPAGFVTQALNEATAFKVVEKLLTTAAHFLTSNEHPHGCMLVQGALSCSTEAQHIHDLLAEYRIGYEAALAKRFDKAKAIHDLPEKADPATLAKMVALVHQGMSVQASNGASSEDLLEVVRLVLKQFEHQR